MTARGEGAFFEQLRQLRQQQFASIEDIRAEQSEKLHACLAHALRCVPLYKQRWPVTDFKKTEPHQALARLPLLSKSDLQEHFEQLQSTDRSRRVTRKTTGGSTGQAVTLIKDREALARELAATWLAWEWYGIGVGELSARFWGAPTTTRRKLRAWAVRLAVRRVNFSAFAFDDVDLERYWKECRRLRPTCLYGYVSMLAAFADYIRRRGYDGRELGVTVVITTSEVLTDSDRALLAQTFHAPVRNEYGCGEVGPIAYECEKGSLHTLPTNLFVEILLPDGRPAARGEPGEVVVTDLNNAAMPLVRYRVGDNASWGDDCSCGRAWPVLERVWGRAYDFVLGVDNRRYHGEYIMYIFEDLRDAGYEIAQFQVEQVDRDSLKIRIVTHDTVGEAVVPTVLASFANRLPGMRCNVELVDRIERAPSGKLRLIMNPWHDEQRTLSMVE